MNIANKAIANNDIQPYNGQADGDTKCKGCNLKLLIKFVIINNFIFFF